MTSHDDFDSRVHNYVHKSASLHKITYLFEKIAFWFKYFNFITFYLKCCTSITFIIKIVRE